jgi:hypothetical protein
MARRKLVKLSIKETSGVDRPAHLHDGWVVMKSADNSELTAVLDELRSEVTEEAEVVKEAAEEVVEETVEAPEELTEETPAETVEAVEATTKATALVETHSPTEELIMSDALETTEVVVIPEAATDAEILKAMPSVIKKMLDDSKATAEQALRKAAQSEQALISEREARADEAAVIKAADWSHLNIDPTIVGPALRRLSENDITLANEIVKALDSANSLLEANVVFTEVGSDAPVAADDAFAKMENLAKAAVASGTAPSYEVALMSVAQANPELYTQYLNEKGR